MTKITITNDKNQLMECETDKRYVRAVMNPNGDLVDTQTSDTIDGFNDKTSGLQFSSEPSERAKRARELFDLLKNAKLLTGFVHNNDKGEFIIFNQYLDTMKEALELMSRETTLNKEGE